MNDMLAIDPGRWQFTHFAWRIGAMSFVNVIGSALAPAMRTDCPPNTMLMAAATPNHTASLHRGFHCILILLSGHTGPSPHVGVTDGLYQNPGGPLVHKRSSIVPTIARNPRESVRGLEPG